MDESDLADVTGNSFMLGDISSFHVVDWSLYLQPSDACDIKSSCLMNLYDLHTYHQYN